jgi:hypothetical protein
MAAPRATGDDEHSPDNAGLSDDAAQLLRDQLLTHEVLFTHTITVRGRQAKVACETRGRRQPRTSRTAEAEVRAATLTLRPPWRHDRKLRSGAGLGRETGHSKTDSGLRPSRALQPEGRPWGGRR